MSKKPKKTEESVEIDLSHLNPFKKKKPHSETNSHTEPAQTETSETSEEFNLDFSKIRKKMANWDYAKISFLILLIVPLLFTAYIRHLPEDLPATDTWAHNAVQNAIKNNIAEAVQKQFPNLPAQNKNELVDQQFQQAIKDNQGMIDQQVQQISQQFKNSFQGKTPKGKTYTFLGDLDSYYWLRYAENLINKGMYCDEVKNGKCWDDFIYAPIGGQSDPTLHPYMITFVYHVMNFFTGDTSILTASFYTVWFGAVIATLLAFLIGRRMVGNYAGFFAAVTLSANALFITRTSGSDNDIWNIVISLLITWAALEAFEAKTYKKTIIYGVLAGIFMGVFAFAWQGWWYLYDFLLIAIVGYIGFLILREALLHKKFISYKDFDLTHSLVLLVSYVVFAGIFVSLFMNFSHFIHDPMAPINFGALKNAANPSIWPNVYTTVAELNPGSINDLITSGTNTNSYTSAKIYFLIALFGILLTLVRTFDTKTLLYLGGSLIIYLFLISQKGLGLPIIWYMILLILPIFIRFVMLLFNPEKIDLKAAILLIIWFAGTAYATTQGVRFALIFLPAFAVAWGVAFGKLIEFISQRFAKDSHKKLLWTQLIMFLLLLVFLITPVQRGLAASTSFIPTIDRGWVDTLTEIKERSAPDAIINSWWDFGHWFKYWAQRRVTLDGATQNHPNAHWLGELMATPNEDESVAILRMLDCGSNNAFESINEKIKDTEFSHELLHKIIMLDKPKAYDLLKEKGFSEDQIQTVLEYTHCNPPEDYFITSEDMVGKAGVWGHFGLWNFTKAYLYLNLKNKSQNEGAKIVTQRYGLTPEQAAIIYGEVMSITSEGQANQWISPWPNYLTGWHSCQNQSQTVTCTLGVNIGNQGGQNLVLDKLTVNMTQKEWDVKLAIGAYGNGMRLGEGSATPQHFFVAGDKLQEMPLNGSNKINIGILFDTDNGYRAMALDPLFGESLFTKLFYLEGRYTHRFEKFSDHNTIGGDRILVWKVNWKGNEEKK